MPEIDITISNKLGLHARAAAKLTQLSSRFRSDIFIAKGAQRVNAKSIMGVMMLAAGLGVTVKVDANSVVSVTSSKPLTVAYSAAVAAASKADMANHRDGDGRGHKGEGRGHSDGGRDGHRGGREGHRN